MLSISAARAALDLELKRTHHARGKGVEGFAGKRTDLLMREAQLVLENGFAIDQILHFIGECVERLDQSLGEVLAAHPIVIAACTHLWLVMKRRK